MSVYRTFLSPNWWSEAMPTNEPKMRMGLIGVGQGAFMGRVNPAILERRAREVQAALSSGEAKDFPVYLDRMGIEVRQFDNHLAATLEAFAQACAARENANAAKAAEDGDFRSRLCVMMALANISCREAHENGHLPKIICGEPSQADWKASLDCKGRLVVKLLLNTRLRP
jgi:hypothetical protein